MKSIQAILFDLDDTLLDDTASTRAGLRALALQQGLDHVPAAAFQARHQEIIEELAPRLFAREVNATQARVLRFEQLLREFGAARPDGQAANTLYRRAYREAWTLCEGVQDTLQVLRSSGYRLAVLSNYVAEVQREKLEHFGLTGYFDGLFFIEDIPAPKPDPRAFLTICERLNVLPEEAVMVGDSLTNDVKGALSAGLRAIWFNRHSESLSASPGVPALRYMRDLPALLAAG